MKTAPLHRHFSRTFCWVTLAHVLVIVILCFWSFAPRSPLADVKFMEVIDPRGLQGLPNINPAPPGSANISVTPPAPLPSPAPQPRVETPAEPTPAPKVEKIETGPTPEPVTPKNDFPAPHTAKPKPKVKVNLNEVVERTTEGTSKTTPVKAKSSGRDPGSSASEVAAQLGKTLSRAGVTGTVTVRAGPVGGGGQGVGASNEISAYYALIQEQMFAAWEESPQYAGSTWMAVLEIVVESSGRISNVSLVKGSGNAAYDASVLVAARRVGQIRRPLPDGLNGTITINFKPGS